MRTVWRFRLSTLLLVITVAAMALALFISLRRERQLTAENRELNALLGRPVITDSRRIALSEDSHFHINTAYQGRLLGGNRFRVYRPPGRKLVLRCAFEKSNGGFPQGGEQYDLSNLSGNELTVDIIVTFDADGILKVDADLSGADATSTTYTSTSFRADDDHWIFSDDYRKGVVQLGLAELGKTPAPSQPDTPLVLVRYNSWLNISSLPRTAVLVWIEDAP